MYMITRWRLIVGALLLAMYPALYVKGRMDGSRLEMAKATSAAAEQTQRMRDLQRAAELRYTVQAETRDRFIVTTVKELTNATTSLAACPVGADAVRLLNDARACADSPASCGSNGAVRAP